jgi:hypothetical protein
VAGREGEIGRTVAGGEERGGELAEGGVRALAVVESAFEGVEQAIDHAVAVGAARDFAGAFGIVPELAELADHDFAALGLVGL